MESTEISAILSQDVPAYCEMFQTVFYQSPWNERWDYKKILIVIKRSMAKKGFIGLVAKKKSKAVGFITGYKVPVLSKFYFVDQLFVHDAYQGQGIGQTLFTEFENRCVQAGCRGKLLLTKANSDAERFYRRNGFKRLMPYSLSNGKVLLYSK